MQQPKVINDYISLLLLPVIFIYIENSQKEKENTAYSACYYFIFKAS